MKLYQNKVCLLQSSHYGIYFDYGEYKLHHACIHVYCKMLTFANLIFVRALRFRVVQKSLVFIVGLSSRFANSEVQCTMDL